MTISLGKYIIINIDPNLKLILNEVLKDADKKKEDALFEMVCITNALSKMDDAKLIQIIRNWFKEKGLKFN